MDDGKVTENGRGGINHVRTSYDREGEMGVCLTKEIPPSFDPTPSTPHEAHLALQRVVVLRIIHPYVRGQRSNSQFCTLRL